MEKQRKTKTSWGGEAEWYADHLQESDTYHSKVIVPHIERLVAPRAGLRVLEVGCGEGFIARTIAGRGARVVGCDISPELIEIGKQKGGGVEYHVSEAEKLDWIPAHSQDVVLAVLTLQNMERIEPVFTGIARALAPNGRFILVVNHPAFRIPKATSWDYDEKRNIQYRRVDAYLSAHKESIDMHPGKRGKKSVTYSFHRSLQDYSKALRAAGFAITHLEEWISHRSSEPGPRAKAENTARKEIPLFLMAECVIVKN
jgi:ubiquinone/menaquinone biosynthesis C-methylase UbiE